MRHFLLLLLPLMPASAQWTRHTLDDSLPGADGVRAADVNGDGWPDLVVSYEQGGKVRAYLHPGAEQAHDAAAWTRIDVGAAPDGEDAVFVDLDGEGRMDVVSASEGSTRQIRVHWAPAAPARYSDSARWATQVLLDDNRAWMFTLPVQLDGQHGLDLVIGSKQMSGAAGAEVGWLQSPADPRGGTWTYRKLSDAGWIMNLIAADIDGDGKQDILLSDRINNRGTRGVRWLENPGPDQVTTVSSWTSRLIGGADKENMFIDYGDLDGNGHKEVVMVYKRSVATNASGIQWFSPPADLKGGTWQSHDVAWPSGTGTAKAVSIADTNRDGRGELVISCESATNKTGVFRLLPDIGMENIDWSMEPVSDKIGIKFDLVPVLDLDGDGWPDILTTEERGHGGGGLGLIWYQNPANSLP
jgi:hypothetical protein